DVKHPCHSDKEPSVNPLRPPKRPFGLGTFLLMLLGVAIVGGIAGVGGAMLEDRSGPLGLALTVATMAVAMAVAFVACIWWWRGIDEAAREAHKWAWWWGGSSGMAIGAILLLTLTLRDDGSTSADVGLSAP